MAWKTVEAPEYTPKTFLRFQNKGDNADGFYVGSEPSTGAYGGTDVTVSHAKGRGTLEAGAGTFGPGETVTFTLKKGAAEKQFQECLEKGLTPGARLSVGIKAQIPTKHANPMNVFLMRFDPDVRAPKGAAAKPKPKPAAPPADDFPAEDDAESDPFAEE